MDPQYEAVQIEGDACLKTFHFECDSLKDDHGWHYHPELELTYIVRGGGTRFVGDSVLRYREGDMVLLGPNLPHCWIDDEQIPQTGVNELVVLQFKQHCLGEDFLDVPEAQPLRQLFRAALRGLHYAGDGADAIKVLMWSLLDKKGLERLTVLLQMLDALADTEAAKPLASEVYQIDNSEFHGGRMTRVVDYVRTNLTEEIKQTEVADSIGMSPQGFSRFFKATTGRTFVSFVNVMRIMEACKLLVNSDQDIIDIAFTCGYGNLSNFNRRFQELKQTTPREYRLSHSRLDSDAR